MMITKILLIYLILMCWYCYSWVRTSTSMVITTVRNLVKHFVVVIGFFVFFFIFIRLMNLFRESKIFDLKVISLDNFWFFVFVFMFIYSSRRLTFYIVKIYWYKLHCFLLSPENLVTHESYSKIFYNIIYRTAYLSYKYLYYMNIVMFLVLILVLMFDLVCNDFVLKYIFSYLVYYSLFKLVYICFKFMITRQNLTMDYYNYNGYYPGNIDTKEFWQTYDSKLLSKARIYKDTIILEQDYFDSRFKHLRGTQKYLELNQLYKTQSLEQFEQTLKSMDKERKALIQKIKNQK